MLTKLFSFILTLSFLLIFCNSLPAPSKPVLMVISYDGFSNEYFKRNVTNYMEEFRREGVSVEYMQNVFPTKTFTNHFSIATGLYCQSHGVCANTVYDSKLGELKHGYELFHYNPNIKPIWTLNEMLGGTSGCLMWPGSEFEYSNVTCTYSQLYNKSMPLKDRIDLAMSWILSPKNPANLVMIYIEQPDSKGHAYGHESQEVTNFIAQLNGLTEYIQIRLKELKLDDRTNVIHLSDHGMESVSSPKFIDLNQYLENNTAHFYGTSPVLQVIPVEGKESEVYTRLKNASTDNGNFNIYKTDTLPERWHCRNKRRFGPILAVSNLHYGFQDMYGSAKYFLKNYNVSISPQTKYGIHGYDNLIPTMRAYFMAKGPDFKDRYVAKPFNNVDLYDLFCRLLGFQNIEKTDGQYSNIAQLLKDPSIPLAKADSSSYPWITGIMIVVVIGTIVMIIVVLYKKRPNYLKFGSR